VVEENDRLIEALERIEQWADAYPLDIFSVPDLAKVRVLLLSGGITLMVSAAASRHVIEGVGKIAREALGRGR
jgi:hypothetical protein